MKVAGDVMKGEKAFRVPSSENSCECGSGTEAASPGSPGARWQGPPLSSALARTCFCPTEASGGDGRLHGGLGSTRNTHGPWACQAARKPQPGAGEAAQFEPFTQDEA